MIAFACRLERPGFTFDVAFEAADGITALFGPSGAGKSTAIRLLAGLERPRAGRISIGGRVLVDTERGIFVPAHRRRVGLVFQDAALLPHLSVRGNLGYGRFFTPRAERRVEPAAVIDILGIAPLLDRSPRTLSGGERQRVAIGRAMLTSPRLLLLDEPLASLDLARRAEILPFIERLRDEFAIPIVYVSHAVEEVARLADTVVRIVDGRAVAVGAPAGVLGRSHDEPTSRFEAVSLLTGQVSRPLPDDGVSVVAHPAGDIILPVRLPVGARVRLAVRATQVALALARPEGLSIRTALAGRVTRVEAGAGALARVDVDLQGGEVLSAYITRLAARELDLAPGRPVVALIKSVAIDERSFAP